MVLDVEHRSTATDMDSASYSNEVRGKPATARAETIPSNADPSIDVLYPLSKPSLSPSLSEVTKLLLGDESTPSKGNTVPVYVSVPADLITPVMAYLRLTNGADVAAGPSFLCESVVGAEKIGRFSFIGANPYKTIRCGPNCDVTGDPLRAVEAQLSHINYVALPELPNFTGGGMGYLAYDCIQHFEPKTKRELKDTLGIPEAVFMFCSELVIFDHIFQNIKCVAHVTLPSPDVAGSSAAPSPALVANLYAEASQKVWNLLATITSSAAPVPLPKQPTIIGGHEAVSNVGKAGYEGFVTALRKHITSGEIIQAVPSQRLAKKTELHPFNAYRHLRQVNPSPYMFYVDAGDCQLVGASPETLCKIEDNKVAVHAIAGTVKRGATTAEDDAAGAELLNSEKDKAEHVMLVDLARNDISRVCDPRTTTVESFMQLEKFSHVIHLTSRITGYLREGKTRFDALRSIFPAGTVSGAPKIRAIELVADLEGERRGVYAGAVGHIGFDSSEMDVAIAIRTMVFKDGTAYLQAGGGIVYDSVEEDEYIETINKLGGNVRTLDTAEQYYIRLQNQVAQGEQAGRVAQAAAAVAAASSSSPSS